MAKNTKRTNKKKYQRKTRKIVGGLPDDLPPGTHNETTTLFTDKDTGNLTNILKHDIKSTESIDGFYEKYQILPFTILPDDGFFNYDFEKISKNAYDNTQLFFNYESDESNNETKSYNMAINTNDDVSDFIKVIQKFRTCLTDAENKVRFLSILGISNPKPIDDAKFASNEEVELLKTYFETIIFEIQTPQTTTKITYDKESMQIDANLPNDWSKKEIDILQKSEYLENSYYVVGQVFGIISKERKTHIIENVDFEETKEAVEKEKKVLEILLSDKTYESIIKLLNTKP